MWLFMAGGFVIFQKWKLGLVASECCQQNVENGKCCVKGQIGLERFSYCTASLKKPHKPPQESQEDLCLYHEACVLPIGPQPVSLCG